VFGCVADQLSDGRSCLYNAGSNACSFAIAVGVIAFLLCLTFLVKDVLFVIIDYSDTIVVSLFAPVYYDLLIVGFAWTFSLFLSLLAVT
jgi:hypothetical protein